CPPLASVVASGSRPWRPISLPHSPCSDPRRSSCSGGCTDKTDMYQRFYGLRELPFELTPNPRFLYLTPRHREALSNLHYTLSAGKSITVLVGEAGTGKTTLLRAA